ncbi:V-type ATP synthase subunit D [Candidatus Halobeggiatoa sp. HSG11]|nr:V-type ATP synthase subunit D [Candidatus Halobeggiatoa sp. HSG11]
MTAKRLKIPPTKSTLLTLKRKVTFLELGVSLLERKKELLTRLVYERLKQYRELRNEAKTVLETAYHWLGITHTRMGDRSLQQAALGLNPPFEIKILPHSSIGVQYPAVAAKLLDLQPVGLMGTDTSFDETRHHLADMVVLLAKLGEAETALWRLLEEQRKTQKRVNALKYNVIPKYHNTIHFIKSTLEEEDRNTLFQIKILRENLN